MECPVCGYVLAEWERDCPRCARGTVGSDIRTGDPPATKVPPQRRPVWSLLGTVVATAALSVFATVAFVSWRAGDTGSRPKSSKGRTTKVPWKGTETALRAAAVQGGPAGAEAPPARGSADAAEPQPPQQSVPESQQRTTDQGDGLALLEEHYRREALRREQAVAEQKAVEAQRLQMEEEARRNAAIAAEAEHRAYVERELPALRTAVREYNRLLRASAQLRETSAYSARIIGNAVNTPGSFAARIPTGYQQATQALELYGRFSSHPLYAEYYHEQALAFRPLPQADLDFLDRALDGRRLARLRFVEGRSRFP